MVALSSSLFLGIILTITVGDTVLSLNYFIRLSTKSRLPSKRRNKTHETLGASIKIGFWKYFQIFVLSEEHILEVALHGGGGVSKLTCSEKFHTTQ